MSQTHYPQYRDELNKLFGELSKSQPDTLKAFSSLSSAAFKPGELDHKTKELIATGIAVAARCDGCIAYHVGGAIRAGATDEEIGECLGVAVLMGGGPSVIYACEAWKAVQQYRESS